MITTLFAILGYIIIHCLAKKLRFVDYVMEQKYTYVILFVGLTLLDVFGSAAVKAVLVAVAVPALAAYSLPSLVAKAREIWARVYGWVSGLFISEPRDIE